MWHVSSFFAEKSYRQLQKPNNDATRRLLEYDPRTKQVINCIGERPSWGMKETLPFKRVFFSRFSKPFLSIYIYIYIGYLMPTCLGRVKCFKVSFLGDFCDCPLL